MSALLLRACLLGSLALALCSCRAGGESSTPKGPSAAQRVRENCNVSVGPTFYFPVDAIDPYSDLIDNSERYTLARYLAAFEAPSLSCGASPDEAYRAIWLPSFRNSVVVLVSRTGSTWRVHFAELEDAHRDQLLKVRREGDLTPSDDQIRDLLADLDAANIWAVPSWKNYSEIDDGATWVIEARLRRGYHVVDRPNPLDAAFVKAGQAFLAIAGLKLPAEAH